MALLIQPRRVPAGHGIGWIRSGAHTLFQSPFGWLTSVALWFFVTLIAMLFPFIGPALFSLSLPGLFAGFMLGCMAIEQNRSLKPRHLLTSFQRNPQRLFQLGLVNLSGETLLSLVLVFWGGQQVINLQTLSQAGPDQLAQVQSALLALSPLLITLFLVQLVLLMMGWFAPALLVFTPLSTGDALHESMRGFLGNLPAFILYTLTMAALLIMVGFISILIPWLSAPLWFFLVALIIASVYASYRDVFADLPTDPSV